MQYQVMGQDYDAEIARLERELASLDVYDPYAEISSYDVAARQTIEYAPSYADITGQTRLYGEYRASVEPLDNEIAATQKELDEINRSSGIGNLLASAFKGLTGGKKGGAAPAPESGGVKGSTIAILGAGGAAIVLLLAMSR